MHKRARGFYLLMYICPNAALRREWCQDQADCMATSKILYPVHLKRSSISWTVGNNSGNKWLFAADYCCKWILACNSHCVNFTASHFKAVNKNIRRKIFRFYGGYGADGGSRTHATVSCPKAFRVNRRKGIMVITKVNAGCFVRWFWAMLVEKTLISQRKIM